jgi:hypothetical protein
VLCVDSPSIPSVIVPDASATDHPNVHDSVRARPELLRANSATTATVRSRSWGKQMTKDEASPSIETREKERMRCEPKEAPTTTTTATTSSPIVRNKLLTPTSTIRYDSQASNDNASTHTALQDMFNQPAPVDPSADRQTSKSHLLPRSLGQVSCLVLFLFLVY